MEFLPTLLRSRFARAQLATSWNVGCFLRLSQCELVVGWKVLTMDSATQLNSGKMTGASLLLDFVSWYWNFMRPGLGRRTIFTPYDETPVKYCLFLEGTNQFVYDKILRYEGCRNNQTKELSGKMLTFVETFLNINSVVIRTSSPALYIVDGRNHL